MTKESPKSDLKIVADWSSGESISCIQLRDDGRNILSAFSDGSVLVDGKEVGNNVAVYCALEEYMRVHNGYGQTESIRPLDTGKSSPLPGED